MNRIGFTVSCLFLSSLLYAQNAADSLSSTSIDSAMRSHNKIYVVMAVCIVILVVLFLYLIRIDRKISKKEKSSV
jgi:fucose permease